MLLLLFPYASFSDVVSVWALRLSSTNRWGWRVLRQEYFPHCDFRRTPSPLRFPSHSMLEKHGQHLTDLRCKNVFLFSRPSDARIFANINSGLECEVSIPVGGGDFGKIFDISSRHLAAAKVSRAVPAEMNACVAIKPAKLNSNSVWIFFSSGTPHH